MQVVAASAIPDGWMGLDIGPESVKTFNEALDTTQTIIWNGPMGVFEFDKFAVGTEVSKKLNKLRGDCLFSTYKLLLSAHTAKIFVYFFKHPII